MAAHDFPLLISHVEREIWARSHKPEYERAD